MYVKIEWINKKWQELVSDEAEPLATVRGFDCKKYRLWDQKDGTFLCFDDSEETYEVSRCKVFVMNKNGKTVDRLA